MRAGLLLLGLSIVAVAGCDSESAPVEGDEEGAEVRAIIGAEGGVLEGRAGTELEGVRLTIPKDALAADTEVFLRPTFVSTSLPELSERVGIQVEVGAEAELELPATLELPFDAGAVARFGEAAEDVKVWVLGSDSWSLVEASGASDATVTIPLERFATAAAGVKVLPRTITCGATCVASAADHFDDANCGATIACATAIVSPRDVAGFDFAASATKLAFLSPSGLKGVTGVSLDPASMTFIESPALSLSSSTRGSSITDGTSNTVMGLGTNGNAVFSGTTKPKVFDVGSGLGAVTLANGTTIRLSRDVAGKLAASNHTSGKSILLPPLEAPSLTNANIASIFVSPPSTNIILLLQADRVVELTYKTQGGAESLVQTGSFALPQSIQVDGEALLAANVHDKIMVIAVSVRSSVFVSENRGAFTSTTLGFPTSCVGVDAAGRVVAGASQSPELAIIEGGSITGMRLSDAAADSPELAARIPRAIRSMGSDLVVLTQDRNFVRVSLND